MGSTPTAVKLGKQGRLVIPAPLRRELGLSQGAELVARAENGCLILEPKAVAIDRLRERFRKIEGSLADELLAERREEAAREQTERFSVLVRFQEAVTDSANQRETGLG